MIHSSRPTVSPVANIDFNLFYFARFWKVVMDRRTDGQHVRKQLSLYRPWLWVGRVDQKLRWKFPLDTKVSNYSPSFITVFVYVSAFAGILESVLQYRLRSVLVVNKRTVTKKFETYLLQSW